LLLGEHATSSLSERGHGCAGYSVGDGLPNGRIISDGKKEGVTQSDRCSSMTVQAMASCTVLAVKCFEVHDLIRWNDG
jgi:hypothetical protein